MSQRKSEDDYQPLINRIRMSDDEYFRQLEVRPTKYAAEPLRKVGFHICLIPLTLHPCRSPLMNLLVLFDKSTIKATGVLTRTIIRIS